MEENNKLIAEFAELEKYGENEYLYNNTIYSAEDLLYDKLWDWLIPAIEKARQLKFYDSERLLSNIDKSLLRLDLIATYRNLVDFIKWYNQQNAA